MTRRPSILVVGEAITAFVTTPDEPALRFRGPFVSGAPVIFASAAARLGAAVELVAGVGDDDFGDLFLTTLHDHGVGLGAVSVDPELPTSSAFVMYRSDGTRDFVFYLQGTAALSVPPSSLDRLPARADWLHVSGSALAFGGELAETSWRAIEDALASGTPISFDPNVRGTLDDAVLAGRVAALLERASVVLASAGELEQLGAADSALVARGATVCRKLGAEGAVVIDASGTYAVPAPSVREVDPDGAGDIFAAGFVTATLLGYSPVEAADVACRVAAISVETWGPLNSRIDALDDRRTANG